MRKNIIQIFIVFIIMTSVSVWAANDNTNFLNGKPFNYLQEEIDANTAAIAENAESIVELEETTQQLRDDLDQLSEDFDALEQRVTDNEDNIATLFSDVSGLQEEVDDLFLQMEEMGEDVDANADAIAFLDQKIAELEAADAAMWGVINGLRSSYFSLSRRLTSFQYSVNSQIQSLWRKIYQIQYDLNNFKYTTTQEIAIANSNISYLLSQVIDFQNRFNSLQSQINSLSSRIRYHRHSFNGSVSFYVYDRVVISRCVYYERTIGFGLKDKYCVIRNNTYTNRTLVRDTFFGTTGYGF